MSNHNTVRLSPGIRRAQPAAAGVRGEAGHSFTVAAEVDRVFGLLNAVSERDWVADWDPTPVYRPELSREDLPRYGREYLQSWEQPVRQALGRSAGPA